jgi:enoyl-CoA hydratase
MDDELCGFTGAGMTTVQVTDDGPVRIVMLSGPDSRNAVGPDTALALHRAFVDFDATPSARVAVLHGAGGHFCAGFDLNALAAGTADRWIERVHFGTAEELPLGPMGPTRLVLSKPVIAAVAGAAVAGGMELALWCDLRVMEATSYMGVYCRRWGVPLIDGGTVRLPRLVGLGRALDLILTGRRIDAGECRDIGLCDRLVEDGRSLDAALALATELAGLPRECMQADRLSARHASRADDREALEAEFRRGVAVLQEARAGAGRFMAGAGRHGSPDA